MRADEFSFIADDSKSIHTYRWSPEGLPKACILIAHGMAEHAARYARLAENLTKAGYEVWAPDHRGHGKTAAEGELGWLSDHDGFKRVVRDLQGLSRQIKQERPDLKLFLLGHSWGSFLAQGFLSLSGDELAGCVLSGTAHNSGPLLAVGLALAKLGCAFKGSKVPSPLLNTMSFGAFNNAFKPNRTAFDWLSRDDAEVDKYVADPYCGFVPTFGFFKDLIDGFKWIYHPDTMRSIPRRLPLYLFAGDHDPVGGATGAFGKLVEIYRQIGMLDVVDKLYIDGRHEMLNETNRIEVSQDLIDWLDKH